MREKLSRQRILSAALQLVDEQGIEALSMRRLGMKLSVEAMSLYRHVDSKEALLDGLHETVLSAMVIPPPSDDWCDDMRCLARSLRRALALHPRALPLFATRGAVSAGSLRYVEAALTVVVHAGFRDGDALSVLGVVVAYVVGQAMSHHGKTADGAVVRYDELDAGKFPHLVALAPALARHQIDDEFELGLEALVAGLGGLLTAKTVS
jgi:TetR/AcrR family tetracycline transcriptional repressor